MSFATLLSPRTTIAEQVQQWSDAHASGRATAIVRQHVLLYARKLPFAWKNELEASAWGKRHWAQNYDARTTDHVTPAPDTRVSSTWINEGGEGRPPLSNNTPATLIGATS